MDSKETPVNEPPIEALRVKLRRPVAEQLDRELLGEIHLDTQANDGSYAAVKRIKALKEQLAEALKVAKPNSGVEIDLDPKVMGYLKTPQGLGEDSGLKEEGDRIGRKLLIEEIEADYQQAKTAAGAKKLFNKVRSFFK